jgi:hypothetical protein
LNTVRVRPVPGGWSVDSQTLDQALVFLSGGKAEKAAIRLAEAIASNSGVAHVLVQDQRGLVIGSKFVSARHPQRIQGRFE